MQVTLCGERWVVARLDGPDSPVSALRDRCPHRFAPLSAGKDRAVARLLATAPKGIAFLAVDVRILSGARAFVEHKGLTPPLFSWTIRTRREQSAAARWADAPIFEGYEA